MTVKKEVWIYYPLTYTKIAWVEFVCLNIIVNLENI